MGFQRISEALDLADQRHRANRWDQQAADTKSIDRGVTMEAASSHEHSAGDLAAAHSELRSRDLKALARIEHDIDRLALHEHVRHLDAWGYTVIKGALDDHQITAARRAISRRVERVYGCSPDLLEAKKEDFSGLSYLPYLLYDDPVFPEILMLERPLALVTYLLGESCHLSSIGSHFKGPGGSRFDSTATTAMACPLPFPLIPKSPT